MDSLSRHVGGSKTILFTPKQLDSFHKAAVSLKLFSRAELNDEKNRSLVEKLYVDPLPNEQVFKTLLSDSTTIIVGRKGTGKSTVFQRVQHEIRKNRMAAISAYMDIRNVYESAQIDPITADKIDDFQTALSPDQTHKFLLYKRFVKTLISDIRTELRSQVEQSFLTRLKERMMRSASEVFSGLDTIISKIDNPTYENIDGFVALTKKETTADKTGAKAGLGAAFEVSDRTAKLSGNASSQTERSAERGDEDVYTQILMRVIGINEIIEELRHVLNAIGVRNIYIFLDDFSELPPEAMQILVDSLISPLARWSDFIKFKIAAYPGRVYLGSLDKTKIEEINLDMYGLYGGGGVNKMEEKAIDFVKRVVEKRLQHFCKTDDHVFFDTTSSDFYRTLFYASMANPRTLGHLLLYAHESHLIYNQKIGIRGIQESSQKYYEEKIQPFFSAGKYKVAFEERSSIFSLRELLESIISRARSLRQEGSRLSTRIRGRSYASHFYVTQEYEDLLRSLELSFFLTKYFEQSDRAGKRVSIYALNYGLCIKYQIGFGRPSERREDRLYFVDRHFDYNGILRSYMNSNQEIKCNKCSSEFDLDILPALKMFHMRCPKCEQGECRIVNLSRKYGDIIESVRADLLLPDTELGILQTLNSESRTMVASEIAGELDCSGQLVGRRARNLSERSLVTREQTGNVYRYELTSQARRAYFDDAEGDELKIGS